jgi:hypothetical protein
MVQSKYSPEEALQRIKLMMEYDLSKTSTENKKVVSEQTVHAGYTDPNQQRSLKRKDSLFKDELKNQRIDVSACRKFIKNYEESWRTKKVIPSDEQTRQKNIVQTCAYQHYNKFGIGGGEIDKLIDVLSGDAKGVVGPNKSTGDGIWKIESPNRN